MRKDMFKVIVERPRSGSGWARTEPPFRLRDLEDGGPAHGPLRYPRHRSKGLNENLSPLYRFLHKSVGRNWNSVHAEVCERLSAGNVVQQHVLQHLTDQVAVHTIMRNGEIWVTNLSWGGGRALKDSGYPLYVHPVSGMLLENRAYTHRKKLRKQRRQGVAARASQDCRHIAPGVQLQRLNGVWFKVRMMDLPEAGMTTFDALLRFRLAARQMAEPNGSAEPDVLHKRQLGKKELRKYGLSGGGDHV